jgi:hypothetical protein
MTPTEAYARADHRKSAIRGVHLFLEHPESHAEHAEPVLIYVFGRAPVRCNNLGEAKAFYVTSCEAWFEQGRMNRDMPELSGVVLNAKREVVARVASSGFTVALEYLGHANHNNLATAKCIL